MSRPHVLIARNIGKSLGHGAGRVRALKGVSLSIGAGELTLLMGPSGSGKTTLLTILGCLLTADAGSLTINGEVTDKLKPEKLARIRREQIGFIFQSYNLFPTLTALENTALALDVRGEPLARAKEQARLALDSVGLSHKLNSFPSEMSGGEQQRVAIARALVGEPAIILADEPTSSLDAKNGQAVMELLARISHENDKAVLTVTHDPRTEAFADRIVYIEDGRITDSDSGAAKKPEAVVAEPAKQTKPVRSRRSRSSRKRRKR